MVAKSMIGVVESYGRGAIEDDEEHVALIVPMLGEPLAGRPREQRGVEVRGLHAPLWAPQGDATGEIDDTATLVLGQRRNTRRRVVEGVERRSGAFLDHWEEHALLEADMAVEELPGRLQRGAGD